MAKTKYKPKTFPLRIEELARDGYSDKEIFNNLKISKDTFYKYLKKYSDFSDALEKGREPINAKVENKFLDRCLGIDYTETSRSVVQTIVKTKTTTVKPDGTKIIEEKLTPVERKSITTHDKHVLPDVGAMKHWLQCKKPEVWKERKELEIKGFKSFADLMMEIVKNEKDNKE